MSYRQALLLQSPPAALMFADASGVNVTPISTGSLAAATLSPASGGNWSGGEINSRGVHLNGTTGYVDLGDPEDLKGNGVLSIVAVVTPDTMPAPGQFQTIVAKGFNGGIESYNLALYNDAGTVSLNFGTFAGDNPSAAWTLGSEWTAGETRHIVATIAPNGQRSIYADGVLKATGPASAMLRQENSVPVYVGASQYVGNPARFFDGTIHSVALFNSTLDPTVAEDLAEAYRVDTENDQSLPPVVTCPCGALGALGQLITEESGSAPRTFSESSIRHEFLSENIGSKRRVMHTGAITGSLNRLITGVREKSYLVQGTISIQCSPRELSAWLPRIFGGPTIGTAINVSDEVPLWDAMIFRDAGIFQVTNLQVAQAIIRGKTSNGGESPEFVQLLLVVVGGAELINTQTWPSPSPMLDDSVASLPYMFWETSLLLNGVNIPYEEFTITIDQGLDIRFYNGRFATCLRPTGRTAKMEFVGPYTCEALLESLSLNEEAGTARFSLQSAVGAMSTVMDFPAIRNTYTTPSIPGNTIIPIEFELQAFSTSTADLVSITHDATP